MNKKGKKSLNLKILIISLVVLIGAVSAVGFMSYSQFQNMKDAVEIDTIYENIFVNDVLVGGMKKPDALKKLTESQGKSFEDKTITVTAKDESISFSYNDLNLQYDFAKAVEQAYDYARDGNVVDRYNKITSLKTEPHKIDYPLNYTYDEAVINTKVAELAPLVNVPAIDASLAFVNGKITITDEQDGYELNIDATIAKVKELISNDQGGTVEGVFTVTKPKFTAEELQGKQQLIGSYKTTFAVDGAGRNDNIFNAASKINGFVIMPDEVFSTNKAFGEMTYDNGYRLAPVIESGKIVQGMGGGVCQVSSTLYNAVLYSELEVVERQNHSLKVGYVDWGFDATLAGDYIDFKFKNDTKYPVVIEAKIENRNTLAISIYGEEIHSPSRKIVFQKALTDTVGPGPESVINDPNLPLGQRVVETASRTGYKYSVYKIVYENDKEVEKTLANTSYYKPTAGVVRVGTGAAAPSEDETPQPVENNPPAAGSSSNSDEIVQNQPTPTDTVTQNPSVDDLPVIE